MGQMLDSFEQGSGKLRAIKTYVKRAGRVTSGQLRAFQELGERFLIPFETNPLDVTRVFGQDRAHLPLVFEIGFGMGEASSLIAQNLPEVNFLCTEVHEPGVGALLKRIGEMGLNNIRICAHDAVEILGSMILDASLDGIHIFFPDPWHKARHNKRRLIQMPLVRQLAQKLKPQGYLHLATDWQPYAEQMLAVLSEESLLKNRFEMLVEMHQGFATKPDYRPLTKFEQRGLRLGHGVWDLIFEKKQQET